MIAIAHDQKVASRPHTAFPPAPADDYRRFLELLPGIRRHARFRFQQLRPEAREEAVEEVIANAFVAFAHLAEQGKADLAYATPLARYAVAQVYEGRRVGGKLNVRDVTSEHCRRKKGVMVARLDRFDEQEGVWREILVEDPTCTPADLAASRIDYPAWLATLGRRNRRIAEVLAAGAKTKCVARRFGVSPARISQLRQELAASWTAFHGEQASDSAWMEAGR